MSASDYYPFGYNIPNRTIQSNEYRYGFNGKEKDENGEWGSQTHYDYGFRIYNPSIARFLSVDPLSPDYPWYTPYQFAGNKPIQAIDLDGLETFVTTTLYGKNEDPKLAKAEYNTLAFEIAMTMRNYIGPGHNAYQRSALGEIDTELYQATFNYIYYFVGGDVEAASNLFIAVNSNLITLAKIDVAIPNQLDTYANGYYSIEDDEYRNEVLTKDAYLNDFQDLILTAGKAKAMIAMGAEAGSASAVKPSTPRPKAYTAKLPPVTVKAKRDLKITFSEDSDGEGVFVFEGKTKTGENYKFYGTSDATHKSKHIEVEVIMFGRDGTISDHSLKGQITPRILVKWKNNMVNWAKNKGYESIRIYGERSPKSSSSNPGHDIDVTIPLKSN